MGIFGDGAVSASLSVKLGVVGVVSRFMVSAVLVLLKVGIGGDCGSGHGGCG